jgi:hypothetical protein
VVGRLPGGTFLPGSPQVRRFVIYCGPQGGIPLREKADPRRVSRHGGEVMIGAEARQSVQFVTVKGKRLAVLSAEDWEALIEWVETMDPGGRANRAHSLCGVEGSGRGP